jgi:hypothetical protein
VVIAVLKKAIALAGHLPQISQLTKRAPPLLDGQDQIDLGLFSPASE